MKTKFSSFILLSLLFIALLLTTSCDKNSVDPEDSWEPYLGTYDCDIFKMESSPGVTDSSYWQEEMILQKVENQQNQFELVAASRTFLLERINNTDFQVAGAYPGFGDGTMNGGILDFDSFGSAASGSGSVYWEYHGEFREN